VSHVPENCEFVGKDFGFKISYKKNKNTISLAQEMYIKTIAISSNSFSEWNEMIKQLNKAYSKTVQISRNL
jgi:hypothetical protein